MSPSSQPLVSVIIASYNHAAYIEASIASVLAQTYPNIELLVVDDGSSDGSVEIIRGMQKLHGFDFVSQTNKGLSRTLNEAIARSRGELIAPFGSDDVMLPERIATQVAYMRNKPEVGICAGGIRIIDGSGEETGVERCPPQRRLSFEDIFLGRQPGAPTPTLLFRREALDRVGGFDPDVRLEDLMIELKVSRAGYAIDVLDTVLSLYRVHDANTYKNHRFMVRNVLDTYARFADHPEYERVCAHFRNSMFVKCARQDKALARELLRDIPLSSWNMKTVKGLVRLLAPA